MGEELQRGLWIGRSPRVEDLAAAMFGAIDGSMPGDPMEAIQVVVGSRGMERWLRHAMASRGPRGICANVRFDLPERALAERIHTLLGRATPAEDPWLVDNLAWHVLRELRACGDDPAFAMVQAWLGASTHAAFQARAWSLAREIADVIDRVIRSRPEDMVLGGVPPAMVEPAWLGILWERLRASIDAPHFADHLRVLDALPAAQHAQPVLRVFGVSALPPALLKLLAMLGRHGRVELYAFVPSEAWRGDEMSRSTFTRLARSHREEGREAWVEALRAELESQNPLLTSLGRLSRDFQAVIEADCGDYADLEIPSSADEQAADSLLTGLQRDIVDARATMGRRWNASDRSVAVHACFGPRRQVEVLREQLLHLFDSDPSIQPRDVLVMTPDLATYAPLVATLFGVGREVHAVSDGWGFTGAPAIPVRIHDLGLRTTNGVADALVRLLVAAEGRLLASSVLDLLSLWPVRERFGLAAEDLDEARSWLVEAGFRWGVDAQDRTAEDLPNDPGHTLDFALRRLARGAVEAADRVHWAGGVAPFDDIEGGAIASLGRVMHFLRTLAEQRSALQASRSPEAWAEALEQAMDLLTRAEGKAAFLKTQVREALVALRGAALRAGFADEVSLSFVRRWLTGRFDMPLRGDRVASGSVTMSALTPMRSVPYKVVVLLGMDDATFPRRANHHGFDPLGRAPRLGDRDPRDEDRHLFLEALLSARSHFLVVYSARHEKSNEPLPPAVPLADLLDALDRGWAAADGQPVSARITRAHPLQPFGEEGLKPGPSGLVEVFGTGMRDVAMGIRDDSQEPHRLFGSATPLGDVEALDLSVQEFSLGIRQPVQALQRRRLKVYLDSWDETIEDREPLEVDALARHGLVTDLLELADARGARSGDDSTALFSLLAAEGKMPAGGLGRAAEHLLWSMSRTTLAKAEDQLDAGPASPVRVCFEHEGLRVSGQVQGPRGDGDTMLRMIPRSPNKKPRFLLRAWLELLLVADALDTEVSCVVVGSEKGVKAATATTLTVDAATARTVLKDYAELYRVALNGPVRAAEDTTAAFAMSAGVKGLMGEDSKALSKGFGVADKAWYDSYSGFGEATKRSLFEVFGEAGPHRFDIDDEEAHAEFLSTARRIWLPLLRARGDRG